MGCVWKILVEIPVKILKKIMTSVAITIIARKPELKNLKRSSTIRQ